VCVARAPVVNITDQAYIKVLLQKLGVRQLSKYPGVAKHEFSVHGLHD